jgi:hypothetical protein
MPLYSEKKDVNRTFINISKGRFYTKEKGQEPVYYKELEGYLTGFEIAVDYFEKKSHEVIKLFVTDGNEYYSIKIRTDSGYFRTFCNALKNAYINEKFIFSPFYTEEPVKRTVLFIKQIGKDGKYYALKFAHTKNNMGDCPDSEKLNFNGNVLTDYSKQTEYYKKYLRGLTFLPYPKTGNITAEDLIRESISKSNENLDDEIIEDLPF